MIAFLSVIHALVSILLVVSILLQSSRGGGLAGMFGGGGGIGGVFGGRGAASFLSKVTMWLAIGFATTSLTIGFLSSGRRTQEKTAVQEILDQEAAPTDILPAIPGASGTGEEAVPQETE
ncbi:preprotein translocase subunit SecG [bacterium]|nr:preprotein translocase subunit SecG [bacterium]